MQLRARASAAVTCLAFLALLVACSSSSTATDLPAFTPDQSTWALPLDAFTPIPDRQQYALNLLWSACMDAHSYPEPAIDPAVNDAPALNQYAFDRFDLVLAEKYGYHSGAPQDISRVELTVPKAAAGQDIACSRSAQRQIHVNMTLTNFAQMLGITADDSAASTAGVAAAAKRWHSCMLPLGISDLPTSPAGMPSKSQLVAFGMYGNSHAQGVAMFLASSTTEIRQAVFDARCRESSGYSRVLYRADVAAEQKAIRDNATKLSEVLAALRQENVRIADTLAKYGH